MLLRRRPQVVALVITLACTASLYAQKKRNKRKREEGSAGMARGRREGGIRQH